jgi:hypothetical protein
VRSLGQTVFGAATSNWRSSKLVAATRSGPPWQRGLRPYTTCAHKPSVTHQAMHAMPAATLAQILQILGHRAMSVHAAAGQPLLLDQPKQAMVLFAPMTHRRLQPCVLACSIYLQHSAHRAQPELSAVRLHERVLCLYPLAKYAAFLGCRAPQ